MLPGKTHVERYVPGPLWRTSSLDSCSPEKKIWRSSPLLTASLILYGRDCTIRYRTSTAIGSSNLNWSVRCPSRVPMATDMTKNSSGQEMDGGVQTGACSGPPCIYESST